MFFFSSRRRHTRSKRDWSSDVCSSDLPHANPTRPAGARHEHPHSSSRRQQPVSQGTGRLDLGAPGLHGGGGRQHLQGRSEERRVGKECRSRVWPHPWTKITNVGNTSTL